MRTIAAAVVALFATQAGAAEPGPQVNASQGDLIRSVVFPENWWGWSGKKGEAVDDNIGFLAGGDGALYVWTTDGSPGVIGMGRGPDHAPTRFSILNVFTGAEVASSRTDPDALNDFYARGRLEERLGLRRLEKPTPQVISTYQFAPLACVVPKKILIGQKFYLYEWLSKPFTQALDVLAGSYDQCTGVGAATRTADYESLIVSGYGPFKDGSIVGVVNEAQAIEYKSWVIRFKPDLTSPFFAGRTDIVPVDQKTVFDTTFFTYKMDFENHNYDPPDSALEKVLADMRAVLVEATRKQAAQRP